MNMNNLTHALVDYYDVGSFHATIFKYTRDLRLQQHDWYNRQQGIGFTLIGLQGSPANTSNSL